MAREYERKPVANIAPFGLRMQPSFKAKIERAARSNNRSVNAEIVARLEQTLADERTLADTNQLDRIERAISAIAAKVGA